MQSWLQEWYGVTHQPDMGGMGGQMREWLCEWYGICGNSRRKPA
jgi:hypothetical protein